MKVFEVDMAWEQVKNGFLNNWVVLVGFGMVPVLLSLVVSFYVGERTEILMPDVGETISEGLESSFESKMGMQGGVIESFKNEIKSALSEADINGLKEDAGIAGFFMLVFYLVYLVFGIGLIKAGINIMNGNIATITESLPSVEEYFKIVGVNIVVIGAGIITYMLIVGLVGPTTDPINGVVGWGWMTWLLSGLIAMVPLMMWFYFTMFTSYFILSQSGAIESLTNSIKLVKENFGDSVKLSIVVWLIGVVGSWVPIPGLDGIYTPVIVLFYCYFFIKMTGISKKEEPLIIEDY